MADEKIFLINFHDITEEKVKAEKINLETNGVELLKDNNDTVAFFPYEKLKSIIEKSSKVEKD